MNKKSDTWTIGGILKWTGQYFQDKGVESPRLDAEVLLSHVLGKQRIYLYVHFDEPLQSDELAKFKSYVKQRASRIPVAYILGKKEFMGLDFFVSPAVLIPRPDTEILVEAAIERLKDKGAVHFADIGAGSGAVALSMLKNLPRATCFAVDISESALRVAEKNAAELGVEARARFYLGDKCATLSGQTFDAIVSNPPYIPDGDIARLAPEVLREPRGALAGGPDGLDFYRSLIKSGAPLLKEGGFMAFEVGIKQADRVKEMAELSGDFAFIEILKDYGGVDRVAILHKRGDKE